MLFSSPNSSPTQRGLGLFRGGCESVRVAMPSGRKCLPGTILLSEICLVWRFRSSSASASLPGIAARHGRSLAYLNPGRVPKSP